jgi:hypothetical protein
MNKFRFTIKLMVIAIFTLAFASLAQGQASRTWVSGVGDDVNPCSRTAPCKTWAGAISKTAAGGEIDALDPGGYGTLTITKSITVDGTYGAGFGSTLNSGGINGFVINDSLSAAPNTIKVTLRNLSIDGAGTTAGLNGIRFISGAQLIVENVSIENQSNNGIDVSLNAAVNGLVKIRNVDVRRIGQAGISLTNAGTGEVRATIDDSSFTHCANGIHAKNRSRVIVRNSVASNNTTNGAFADATAAVAVIRISSSIIAFNGGSGVRSGGVGGGVSVVEIAQNQINQNTGSGALVSAGGSIETFSNNSIRGNGTDGCVSCTPVGPGN